MKKNFSKRFLLVSIMFFYVSFCFNAFEVNNKSGYYGYSAFIYGFFGFGTGAGLTWFSNPLIIISWFAYRKKISIILSFLALILGLSFLTFEEILIGTNNKYGKITGYDLGYYLWILSFMTMNIGNILNYKKL